MADAKAAGRALTDAGAREVMVFGSVARGDAGPHSDIDLVAVFDDVGLPHPLAGQTRPGPDSRPTRAGHTVEVWLTDVPEWVIQNRRAAAAPRPPP